MCCCGFLTLHFEGSAFIQGTGVQNPWCVHLVHEMRLLGLKRRWSYLAQIGHKYRISLLYPAQYWLGFQELECRNRIVCFLLNQNYSLSWTSERHIVKGAKFMLMKLIIKCFKTFLLKKDDLMQQWHSACGSNQPISDRIQGSLHERNPFQHCSSSQEPETRQARHLDKDQILLFC